MSRPKSYVLTGDKVLCHFTRQPEGALRELVDHCSMSTMDVAIPLYRSLTPSSNPRCKSQSNCDPRDEYDERRGKEIASLKVDKKFHRHREKEYRQMIKLLNKAITEIGKLADIHDIKAQRIEEDLERYNNN